MAFLSYRVFFILATLILAPIRDRNIRKVGGRRSVLRYIIFIYIPWKPRYTFGMVLARATMHLGG